MYTGSIKRLCVLLRKLLLVLFVAFILILNIRCAGNNYQTLKIGVIVPLTGGAADFGMWAKKGVELAITELNNSNKVKVKAIFEDSRMDTKEGIAAFRKLININHVSAVITSGSGVVLGIAPLAEKYKIPQLNHAAVSPKIKNAGDYTFSLVNDANVEAEEIADLMINVLKITKLAVLYANTSYGVGTKDAIVERFKKLGGIIVATESFDEGFSDVRNQLFRLKEAKPEATYFVATIKDSAKILKQAQEIGFKTQWITFNAFESPDILKIAGKAAEGVIYTSSNLFYKPLSEKKEKAFLKKFSERYGEAPNIYAATAYDAVYLIYEAYINTDGTGESIKNYLKKIKNFHGASGVINFDERGSVRKPVFLMTVRNGKFVVYK